MVSQDLGSTGPLSTVQRQRDQFPISVKPTLAKTRRGDRKGFFRLARADRADATPGLGSADQQAKDDFASSMDIGASGPQQLQRKERGELGVQPFTVQPKPITQRTPVQGRPQGEKPYDPFSDAPSPPYVARSPDGFAVSELPSNCCRHAARA